MNLLYQESRVSQNFSLLFVPPLWRRNGDFYESLDQTIKLAIIVVLTVFYLAYTRYQAKKAIENNNDERWQLIQSKANGVVICYFGALTSTFFFGYIGIFIWGIEFNLDIEQVVTYGIGLFSIRYVIEFLALRHYDKAL